MNESWAIVELMGHVRLAGRLTEEERFGAKMGRLDIPVEEVCPCGNGSKLESLKKPPCNDCNQTGILNKFVTQWFGGGSVYRITAVTEEVARQSAKRSSDVAPVGVWNPPRAALPAAPDDFDLDEE